jgi:hypothetical protein
MRRVIGAVLLLAVTATAVQAEAPDTSLRPIARPILAAPVVAEAVSAQAPDPSLRPKPRPAAAQAGEPGPTTAVTVTEVSQQPTRRRLPKLRPEPRPEAGETGVRTASAVRVLPGKSAVLGRKGSVCGVNGIKGETLAPITSRVKGCGIADPVRVTSVDGVTLSMPATLDCPTAKALHDWVRGALKPAFGRSDVAQLQVAAHYACRPRNNVKGAPVSEHGRGKAIDISAIVLKNGKTVSVLDDWRNKDGRPMVKAYRAACGTFGTTLGPDADRYHRNHLHFDTARHGNGPYCR